MIRLFTLAAFLAAALTAAAQQTFELSGDVNSGDANTGEVVVKGHAQMRDGGVLLTADEIRGNYKSSVAAASGHVVLMLPPTSTSGPRSAGVRLLADKLVYRGGDGSFTAENVRFGAYPYFVEASSVSRVGNEIVATHATLTSGEPGRWQPTIKGEKISYIPGQQLHIESAQAGIGGAQPVPFPKFTQDLHDPLVGSVSFTGGFRPSLGVFVDAGLHLPVGGGVLLGGDVAVYSNRGVMVGPSGSYSVGPDGAAMTGYFRTGFINDHGDKKTDLLGRPVPEERGYVEWQHQQQITDKLTVAAQLNYWSDSEVVRDFRPKSFFPVQEPDTFIESNYTGRNFIISAFARFHPNSFQRVQERLPEIRFDLLPTALPGGFVEQFSASYGRLRERGPVSVAFVNSYSLSSGPLLPVPAPQGAMLAEDGTVVLVDSSTPLQRIQTALPSIIYGPNITLQQADRLDAYYAVSRPISPAEWLTIVPLVGGRFTRYTNARPYPILLSYANNVYNFGILPTVSQTRTLGEIGFDAVLRSSGTFAYKNEAWKIDGLRHLFTPRLSYRYVKADKRSVAPQIDAPVFSTYLQPLGLGDTRAIDALESSNTLRLAFENVLQTHDPLLGTRDLASLTIANDFGFSPGRRDLSGMQVEAALMPARWLQLDAYQRYTPGHSTLTEFNTGVIVHDADAWSVRFSNNFLRNQIEAYALDSRFRLNERYDALARFQYDARTHRLNEQAYGLVQNLDNTWRVSYVVSLYSGPRRESHFGLNVQIEAMSF